jgi:hypothetical protein
MIAQFVSFGLGRVDVCVNLKAFNFLSWQVGPDSRPVMRKAYELFRDGGDTKELLAVGARDAHDFFYSHLYVGLFHEAQNNTTAAREAITTAVASPYGARLVLLSPFSSFFIKYENLSMLRKILV